MLTLSIYRALSSDPIDIVGHVHLVNGQFVVSVELVEAAVDDGHLQLRPGGSFFHFQLVQRPQDVL